MDIAYIPLEGRFLRLEPLAAPHKEGLRAALDCDPETWAIYPVNGRGADFDTLWNAMGKRMAYAVRRRKDARIVGMSSYFRDPGGEHSVEIGATFLQLDARGGPTNPEMKLLMLAHAFASGALRVGFRVDVRNARSQAAVLKLGAKKEGVLRKDRRTWTGHVRDTAIFSILDSEWTKIRSQLESRLSRYPA